MAGEDGGVALDAALNAEEEVVGALTGVQILDRVGDHAVQPADAVFSGDTNPTDVVEVRQADALKERGKLWGGAWGWRSGDVGLCWRTHGGAMQKTCVHLIIAVDREGYVAGCALWQEREFDSVDRGHCAAVGQFYSIRSADGDSQCTSE